MIAETRSDFEIWLPPPAAWRVAIGLWIAGCVLAGAAAVLMNPHARSATHAASTSAAPTQVEAPSAGASTDPEGVQVMPQDVVYGHAVSRPGVTLKQKP